MLQIFEMAECRITFPGPVSRETIYHLVIDYLKYVLYYRGQFPLPLEQLKQIFKTSSELSPSGSNNHQIYCDGTAHNDSSNLLPRSNIARYRTKQLFIDTVLKFDSFFNELAAILQSKMVLEIVLNLGPNMMNPKELYRITLPKKCSNPECATDYASVQKCKLQFFREIMQSDLWSDLKTDSLLPISILLLLDNEVVLDKNMEQKRFYSIPKHCKQRTVHFIDRCNHLETTLVQLGSYENISFSCSTSADSRKSGLWVKLKPDLKGFKSYIESN